MAVLTHNVKFPCGFELRFLEWERYNSDSEAFSGKMAELWEPYTLWVKYRMALQIGDRILYQSNKETTLVLEDIKRLIKELGLNFVRLSHYPQSPDFLDACDKEGLLVYAEIATWKSVRTGRWLRAACRQLAGMIERDRRHPSIILWGMGNESRSRRAYLKLMDTARSLDPTRPLIYAENHLYRAKRKRTIGLPDVWGLNYEFDALEEGRQASRLRNVVVSECSNNPHAVRGDPAEEAKQVAMIRADLDRFRDKPYVAGFALWSFGDYATLRKKRYRRFCGIVDAWRVPKMSAALLSALFRDDPFLKCFVDWIEDGSDRQRDVHIFTNCETVEVFCNERKVGEEKAKTCVALTLRFEPGKLRVVGSGPHGSAEQTIPSFGPAHHVSFLSPPAQVTAEARETFPVDLEIRDAQDRLVLWSGRAALQIEGPARWRTHREDGTVTVADGTARAYVTGRGETGCVILKAAAGGLATAETIIDFA